MTWTIGAGDWTRQPNTPILDGNYPKSLRPAPQNVVSMSLPLTTAGRLGFFIDYSERETVGTHTFYVCRTHGTTGVVSVSYSTGGDTHTPVTGTMTWQDGDASIKSFTVEVTASQLNTHQVTNGLGEHRMWAVLSNPTNGGVLHFGTEHTRAYGVIDNNVVASDANAVFYDSEAVTNGTGTQANPYNSVYDAIAAIGSKRYLYGKGTTVPDATNSVNPNGGGGIVDCIILPTGRTGESNRMFIRNWGGATWTITGGMATNKIGFYSDGGTNFNVSNYITFKGLIFTSLNAAGVTFAEGGGIGYFKSGGVGINVEECIFSNINGSTNTSGANLYAVEGAKIWKCTADTIQVNGSSTDGNAGGLCLYYSSNKFSIQRCDIQNTGVAIYPKRPSGVSPVVRFCKINNCNKGMDFGFGSATHALEYLCVQNNIFENCIDFSAMDFRAPDPNAVGRSLISNNVFSNCGRDNNTGALLVRDVYDTLIYNNIFIDCSKIFTIGATEFSSNPERNVLQYYDFNLAFNLSGDRYFYLGVQYPTALALNSVAPEFANNDGLANPLFIDATNGDFTLQAGSPALTGGVDGTQQGAYLSDFYTIGAN